MNAQSTWKGGNMRHFIFLSLFMMLICLAGCDSEEVKRIKSKGYMPPIPEWYNSTDLCASVAVNSTNNTGISLSVMSIAEMCLRQEDDAKENLYKMQKEGKPIDQARWMSCLEYSENIHGHESYGTLYKCAIGKISPPTKYVKAPISQVQSSAKSHASNAVEGEKLHSKIIKKYPSLGREYVNAFVSGSLTSNPICLISVPSKEWAELSNQQKLQLFDYAASLIPEVKANPDKYSGLGPNAPIASKVRQNISRMSNSSWAIDVGDFTNGGRDLLSGNFINTLD